MTQITKIITAAVLALATATAFAVPPRELITHNYTNDWSNAYLGPNLNLPSQKPTPPNTTKNVNWMAVILFCQPQRDFCKARIKMKTNTSKPVFLGDLTMNLQTGDINPKVLKANGYTMKVIGLGETEIRKD